MKKNFVKKFSVVLCAMAVSGTMLGVQTGYAFDHKTDVMLNEHLDGRFSQRTYKANGAEESAPKYIPYGQAYIPKGVKLTIELRDRITSERLSKYENGAKVPFVLRDNLIVNEVIVIPAGTEVMGHVVYSDPRNVYDHGGSIAVQIDSVKTLNGVVVPLNVMIERERRTDEIGALHIFNPIIFELFHHGKNVAFQAGTPFEVMVAEDTDLGVTINGLAREIENSITYTVE